MGSVLGVGISAPAGRIMVSCCVMWVGVSEVVMFSTSSLGSFYSMHMPFVASVP